VVRGHWAIFNSLHSVRNVTFSEDHSHIAVSRPSFSYYPRTFDFLFARTSSSNNSQPLDEIYPNLEYIRLVRDNLNTHTPVALYETFPLSGAQRILQRVEFHYTRHPRKPG
jgi:hypothetical protein